MKLRQCEMNTANFLTKILAGSILGLILCPFAYIAIGALGGFAPAFSLIALPPLLASSACLLYRFLSSPAATSAKQRWLFIQILCWFLIAVFLGIVSGFTLLTTAERFGLFSTLFLACTLLSLPIVMKRNNALSAKLQTWPQLVTRLVAVLILLAAVSSSLFYMLTTAKFI